MPGNKNSGRKKKIQPEVLVTNENETDPPPKRKVGRPKNQPNQNTYHTETSECGNELTDVQLSSSLSHGSKLNKRNSDISKLYDTCLGPSLTSFPASKLPQKRVVLQRYRHLKTERGHNSSVSDITSTISKELIQLWEFSSIPTKNYQGCWDTVKKALTTWADAKKDTRLSSTFRADLDTLLDLRPASCRTLSTLNEHLKKSGNVDWETDYMFFKGQLLHPQTTTMSSTEDATLHQQKKGKQLKQLKAALFLEKNKGEFGHAPLDGDIAEAGPSTGNISVENILPKSPRQCRLKVPVLVEGDKIITSQDKFQLGDADADWQPPLRYQRALNKKPENITLSLPAKRIPSLLAETSTTTKTSTRNELKIVSTLLKAGGADIDQTSCSISTIRRQRKPTVSLKASEICQKIKEFKGMKSRDGSFIVLHWDGKIIQVLSGDTEDRLAIAISSPNLIPGQFVASPVIPDGTGDSMANCVHNKVMEFEFLDEIEAVVFDTTASNTGIWAGSVTLFEAKLGRALLWLACRHHIPELHIKHANEAIRGPSKGPDDALFKEFKEKFQFINLEDRTLWQWPRDIQDWRHQRGSTVLEWADTRMRNATWPREDYRELLELVVVFLGGVPKRVHAGEVVSVNVSIRKPGAIHRARFMASCLYLLKIFLYQKQFSTKKKNIQDVKILAEHIALLHAPYFLRSPLAISAPRFDRDFWVDIGDYKNCFRVNSRQWDMIEAVQTSVLKHLWYLTEELIGLALFDNQLSDGERQAMARKLLNSQRPANFLPGKPKFPIELMTANPMFDSFVGERTWIIFEKLQATGNWLEKDVTEWDIDEEYLRMRECFHDLKVVNDLAERCIKDIQEYADLTKDSHFYDDILLVATDHRGVFQDLRKQALGN